MPDQPKTHQEPTTENAILMERIRELEAKDEVRNWAGELIRVRLSLLEFAATHSLEELLQKTLDEVGVLSDSPIGFYHFVGKDQKTILLQAWSTRTVKEFCKAEGKGMHYGIDQAGVWVDCVRQKRPVIHNDYNSLPHRKGLPEGHPPVIRELVVPIMRDGSVAAILGMGNKPTDYTPRDIEIVSYLADVAWAIIERKRAEEALRESETKYRVLVETAADSIFIAQDGMIKFCNKNFADVSGYGPADLTNMAFSDLVHPDDRQMVFERYMQRLEGKDVPSRYRFRFIDARGNTHWADMSVALISWEGKPASLCLAADITGLKQAEEALRKSEEKFRHLFERAEEGILIVRGETLEFVNPAIERIMGHPMDKLTSGPFINFIHPDDQAEAIDRHLRRMRGEALAAVNDFRVITSDGTVKWITASSQVVEWEGKPANLNFITDITARKLAEEALRESEERYKGLVESSFAGVYVVQNGRFVFLNENAAAFTGYRPEELVGRRSDTIVHPEDLYGVTQKARDMLDSQYSSPYEFRIVTKGGQVRWIMETVASIHYNGSPAILGNSMDITGQKNAEIERQAALESLQAVRDLEKGILQSVPHALFGVERRQIFFANDAMEAVFGWKPEEVIGKSTRVIFRTDEEWAEYGAMLYSRLEKEPLTVFEWDKPFVRKDGSAFFCRMSVSRIGAALDANRRIVATFEDITDRKRAELEREKLQAQLTRAQKLESVGTLAGGIAHDFNNLLMGIQGHASLMMLGFDSSDPHHVRLKHIEELVRSGADLTGQLLGFARGGRYNVKPVSMNEIVEKSSAMFGRTRKEIRIHRKYAKDPCIAEVDRSQMEQVFMNLFVNAWQAMPGGGDIFVETEEVVFDEA